ncbi:MAG: hypothetical protein CMJ28_06885 [Phycisphaerae bacterium]|nr:hypothetical protein [Phycisphaerae bacterium]
MLLSCLLAFIPPLPEAFLDKYCIGCHADEDAESGLDIKFLVEQNDGFQDESDWIQILERIRRRDMPPIEHRRQPDESTMAEAEAALRAWLPAANRSAHIPLRRMTREAWTRAVDELVSVKFPSDSFFPPDDIGEGFDRTASLLRMSPLLVEKYMEAAEKVAATALDEDLSQRFPTSTAVNLDLESKRGSRRLGGVFLSTRGEVKSRFQVDRPGQYEIRAKVAGQQAGPDPVRFVLRAGKIKSQPMDVVTDLRTPATLAFPVSLSAGPIEVGALFTNDFFDKESTKPNDRNALVLELMLVGPLDRPRQDHFLNQLPKSRTTNTLRKVLHDLSEKAFRGKKRPDDVDRLLALSLTSDSWSKRLQNGLVGILMSPRFLLVGEGNNDQTRALDDQEIAARLASFLWDSLPDKPLLREVERGQLSDPESLRRVVKRMLKDRRSRSIPERFGLQWLHLDVLDTHRPDPDQFPNMNLSLLKSMQQETVNFLDHVLRRNLPVSELLKANYTFVNTDLANHYGYRSVPHGNFRRIRTPDESLGLLRHASILMATSNPTRTSPVKRGKWVLTSLLDAPPPPAPPGVDGLAGDGRVENLSLREQMKIHRANPDCASCHIRMDALGFSLERFDPVGRVKNDDDIDDSAELPDGTKFQGANGLRDVLLEKPELFRRSLARHLLVYATQRGTGPADDDLLHKMSKDTITLSEMIELIVLSDSFLQQGPESSGLGINP